MSLSDSISTVFVVVGVGVEVVVSVVVAFLTFVVAAALFPIILYIRQCSKLLVFLDVKAMWFHVG